VLQKLFFRYNKANANAPKRSDVSTFIEQRIVEFLDRPSALPIVFVPDPHQPDFYGRVRTALTGMAGEGGMISETIGGISRRLRLEDGGERFLTLHPLPERHGTFIPVQEVKVSDGMVLLPWHC